MIFIIKGFRTIVFIFIVISTTFRPICPPAFFRCLSNSGTYTELRTTSVIASTGVTCSGSVSHNRVQVLGIPVFLLTCSQDWTFIPLMIVALEELGANTYNRYAMCPAGQFSEFLGTQCFYLTRITTIIYYFLPVLIFIFFSSTGVSSFWSSLQEVKKGLFLCSFDSYIGDCFDQVVVLFNSSLRVFSSVWLFETNFCLSGVVSLSFSLCFFF